MENFRKMYSAESEKEKKDFEKEFVSDVKKHLDAIANKYILTGEGTIDYALMYVPSESIYYEIVNNPGLFDYSSAKRVLPVSPMTFYAYLKAILMGFEGQKITLKAREILSGIRSIQKEYEKLGESIDTLNKHIKNSNNMAQQVQTGYSKLGRQITTTSKIEETEMKSISEFLTNPLLVSLLFTAFQHKQTIPFKKHIFYRQVYDANFESHDLTKGDSYTHDKYTKLEIDDFHRVLRHLGFSCLKQNQKIEFTKDEILSLIHNARVFCVDLDFSESDFLKDLLSTVPLFSKDGIYYRWAHKSLQDYFAALG